MKARFLAALFALLSTLASAQTTNTTGLPNAGTLTGGEWIPADQGSATVRVSPGQLSTYLSSTTQTLTNKSIAASEVNSGTLSCSVTPAMTGDMTSSAGSCATTVSGVNGGTIPTSAGLLGTNSSGQLIVSLPTTFQASGSTLSSASTVNYEGSGGVSVTNPSAGNVLIGLKQPSRTVTSATDTILSSDAAELVAYDSPSSVAVSIPAANASGFGAQFAFATTNYGSGTVTFTPAASIDGNATIVEQPGTGCTFWEDSTPTWHIDSSACSALTGTVSSATNGKIAQYASSGNTVTGATVQGGLSLSGNILSQNYSLARTVTGSTDTIASTDCGYGVVYPNSGAVTITIPQATGSFANCSVDLVLPAGTEVLTITPTTSTINTASSVSVTAYYNTFSVVTVSVQGGNYVAALPPSHEVQEVDCGFAGAGAITISSITQASPAVITLAQQMTSTTVPAGTNWACPVNFTGTLPTGFSSAVTYYVSGASCSGCNGSTPSFPVSTTMAGALAGTGLVASTSAYTSGGSANPGIYAPTTATWFAGAGLNLTPGDWDCYSLLQIVGASLTTYTGVKSSLYSTAATVPPGLRYTTNNVASSSVGSPQILMQSPMTQVSITSTTSEYGNTFITYGGGSVTLDAADIRCRRMF